MELRRVFFEYRLKQAAVGRAARAAGHKLHDTQISSVARGEMAAYPSERDAIRDGLAALGVPTDVIDAVPELKPRLDLRLKENRIQVAPSRRTQGGGTDGEG